MDGMMGMVAVKGQRRDFVDGSGARDVARRLGGIIIQKLRRVVGDFVRRLRARDTSSDRLRTAKETRSAHVYCDAQSTRKPMGSDLYNKVWVSPDSDGDFE
jgi:hypothetical protein